MTVKIKANLKQAGFTLIEMLLVIAIIGVLTTMAITTFQKRSESARMEKAALQMQQLLQAGLAYQVANGKWPNYPASNNNPDFSPYISSSGAVDPWGYNYTWQGVGGTNNNLRFRVQAQTPDPVSAQQLAAALPNALSSGNSVIAEVGLPGAQISAPRVFIVDVGTVSCETGSKSRTVSCSGASLDGTVLQSFDDQGVFIPMPVPGRTDLNYPPCPLGYTPKISVALTGFEVGKQKISGAWNTTIARPISVAAQAAIPWPDNKNWYYVSSLEGYYGSDSKTQYSMVVSSLYTVYCLKN